MIINSSSKIIMCPECKGEGQVDERVSLYDSEYKECPYCKGKRVVLEKTTTEHKSIE
ncbi:hypothetical protein [Clostridium sp.]|uniref:hypothetical protein n=1 Tax=Clostridium sp. TaxID=1506 RepID=UPI0026266FE0|nr:hypothetical protein [Clostridium sp.]